MTRLEINQNLFSGQRKKLKNFATVFTNTSFNKEIEKGRIFDCEYCILVPNYIRRVGEFTNFVKPGMLKDSENAAFVIVCKNDYSGYIAFLLDSILCRLHFFGGKINCQDSVRVTKKILEELPVVEVPESTYAHYAMVEQLVKMLRNKMTDEGLDTLPSYTANTLTEVRDAMAIELMLHGILEKFDVKLLAVWMEATEKLRKSEDPADIHTFVKQTLMPGGLLLNNVMKMTMVLNNINKLIIDAQK